MSNNDVLDAIVIGGGVAGLSCAWRLQRAGLSVKLFEAADQPGGHVRTIEDGGFRIEHGPHSLMASGDQVFAVAEEVGLTDQLTGTRPESGARFIARNGRLHAMPTSLWSFLTTRLLSFGAKLMLATEPLRLKRGRPDDSAATFFKRRFGAEAARVLAGAFISGVYAGDPEKLSARAAFALFWGFEQSHGSMILGALPYYRRRAAERKAAGLPARKGLYSFRGGLGRYPEAVAERLGESYLGGCPVTGIEREMSAWRVDTVQGCRHARSVVLAVPPREASELLAGQDQAMAQQLAGIPLAPVAVVHMGFHQRQEAIPEGFGFLVPRDEGVRSLGVLFPSRLFTDRTPQGGDLLAGFVGGVRWRSDGRRWYCLVHRVADGHVFLGGLPAARQNSQPPGHVSQRMDTTPD